MDENLFSDAVSGKWDDSIAFEARRAMARQYESKANAHLLHEKIVSAAMKSNPLVAMIVMGAPEVAEVFEDELRAALVPFLFAAEREQSVAEFLVSPFLAGETDENPADVMEKIRIHIREMEKSVKTMESLDSVIGGVALPELADMVDEWAVMQASELWDATVYATALVVGLMGMTLLMDGNMPVLDSLDGDLLVGVGRFVRLYGAATEGFTAEAREAERLLANMI